MSHPLYAAPKKSRQPNDVPHQCYQVDFAAVNCGKMVAASKRRIRFKFGYTNVEAMSDGCTGQDCRGSEHDVTITWSLSSGKQSVVYDGKEMYFDVGDTTKVKCTFKDKDDHTIEVKAHAAPMSTKSTPDPDWRQYDLLIDGISYFRYPKIYQLGVFDTDQREDGSVPLAFRNKSPRAETSQRRSAEGPSYDYNTESVLPKEEESATKPVEVADLLSFDDSEIVVSTTQSNNYAVPAAPANVSAPAPTLNDYSSNQFTQSYAPAPTNSYAAPSNQYGNQFEQQMSPGNAQYSQYAQQTSPVTPNEGSYGFAPPNNQYVQSNQYANYQASINPFESQPNPNPPTAYNNSYNQAPAGYSNSYNQPAPTQPQVSAPQTYAPAPITPNTSSQALVPAQAPTTATGATSNLVNLDDLFAPSAAAIAKQAPQPPAQTSGQKKPVMNTFNPAPMNNTQYQQQGMYHLPQYNQQPQQQQGYNNYQYQQYPPQQQGYAQGFQQPGY